MNVSDLAKGVAEATGSNEAAAVKGEEVSIPGFGKFTVKDRPEREGRNPGTGEAITIAASKKVAFTAAKGLKDRM
jgi:DNA-binding protein HU-beta